MTGAGESGGAAAVFLDRDGTLIVEDGRPIARPEQVVLLPGAGAAVRRLRAAGYRIVVVTNQSAVGRGELSEVELARVHAALAARLAEQGGALDALYFSPDRPEDVDGSDPFAMRKPGAGMLLRAAREHGLALPRCWMVGDQLRDALAGRRARCRGSLLVRTGVAPLPAEATAQADGLFDDLAAAADHILSANPDRPAVGPADCPRGRPADRVPDPDG